MAPWVSAYTAALHNNFKTTTKRQNRPQPKQIQVQRVVAVPKPKPRPRKILLEKVVPAKPEPQPQKLVLEKVNKPSKPRNVVIRQNPMVLKRVARERPQFVPVTVLGNTKPIVRKFIRLNDKDDNTSNMEVKLPFQPSRLVALRRNEPFQLINDPSLRYKPNVERISRGKRLIPVYRVKSPDKEVYLDSDIPIPRRLNNLGRKAIKLVKIGNANERDDDHGDEKYIKLLKLRKGSQFEDYPRKNDKVTYIHKDIILEPKYISSNQIANGRHPHTFYQQGMPNQAGAVGAHPPVFGIPRFPMPQGTGGGESQIQAQVQTDQHLDQKNYGGEGHGEFGRNSIDEFKESQPWYLQSTFILFFLGIILIMVVGGIAIYYIAA